MAGQAIVDRELTLDDFDFPLPAELIAQEPLAERGASRLLHVTQDALHDRAFADLERLLIPGDLLVFNDTRVIKARLFGHKPSGGRVEVLVERVLEPNLALALARTSHRPNIGTRFIFGEDTQAIVEGRRDDFFLLRFGSDVHTVLQRHGHVPLPPYITHSDSAIDAERYQTVYATQPGAVAAPTAGLHFTSALLERLRARGVQTAHITLHVGAGTFQPVRAQRLTDHRMHSEWYSVPTETASAVDDARRDGRNVVAVGTTSLRALESAASEKSRIWPGSRETALFITPGFSFRIVDRLITNFHLPRSTLLMLVSAFAGVERIREAYSHAIERRYRFFSYGDAMLLERAR